MGKEAGLEGIGLGWGRMHSRLERTRCLKLLLCYKLLISPLVLSLIRIYRSYHYMVAQVYG
jgi:hypothetical protein